MFCTKSLVGSSLLLSSYPASFKFNHSIVTHLAGFFLCLLLGAIKKLAASAVTLRIKEMIPKRAGNIYLDTAGPTPPFRAILPS